MNLAWAWQMALLFGVIITALLTAVLVNDAVESRWRRRPRITVERRRS